MAPERVERKLVTIFAAGVAGYLPFMRADGEATLTTLGDYREVINTLTVRHDGRVKQGTLLTRYHTVGQIATRYGFNRNRAALPN